MGALPGEYGGDTYGGGLYGGGVPTMPTLHVRAVLDADPLVLGGIVTGDSSTLESLGAWTAGANTDLTLNTATSRVYTGHGCARLEAVAPGDISMLIFGVGTVTPGRTYLMWVHVRAEDLTTPRTARAVLLWKSATDVFLLADLREQVEVSAGYVR